MTRRSPERDLLTMLHRFAHPKVTTSESRIAERITQQAAVPHWERMGIPGSQPLRFT